MELENKSLLKNKNQVGYWFALSARLFLGGAFVYSGLSKLWQVNEFASNIALFDILPNDLIEITALGLPLFEANLGLWLILGVRLRASSFGMALLTSIFFFAVVQAWVRGLDIECYCFGESSTLTTPLLALRNLVLCLIALGLLVYAWRETNFKKNII